MGAMVRGHIGLTPAKQLVFWLGLVRVRLGCHAHILLEEPNRQYCIVRGFEEEDSLENVQTILFCILRKRCV